MTTLALPDDYGGGLRELYVTDSAFEPITVVDETTFKRQKQGGGTVTATDGPTIAMIYRSADAGATESERYTIEVYPSPAGTVTVDYFYDSIPDMIGTTSEYPFGAQLHGETMVASCLAVTEFRENEGAKGEFYASFLLALTSSITRDKSDRASQAQQAIYSQTSVELTGLAVTYPYLVSEIGKVMGYGAEPNGFTNAERHVVERTLQSGLRQFYYPPVLPGEEKVHRWSFLTPIGTLATVSATEDYDLPNTLSSIRGSLTFTGDNRYHNIEIIPESRLRYMRSSNTSTTSFPIYAAVRPKDGGTTGTAEQLQEIMLYPTPNAVYNLEYRYELRPTALTTTNLYSLAGPEHGETILGSCMAVVENDVGGVEYAKFMLNLRRSVISDGANEGADSYGYNGNGNGVSGGQYNGGRGQWHGQLFDTTYSNTLWD